MKTNALYGIVTDSNSNTKTRLRCVFCGVHIPKANKCIEQHTQGTKHNENIEIMAENENGIIFNENQLHCNICNRDLCEDESVSKHVECDEHATWMAAMEDLVDGEFINLAAFLSGEKQALFCELCNTDIPSSLLDVQEHVNSFSHRCNVCEKLKPLNGIFAVENDDEVWCKICDTYLENAIKSILEHIDDDEQHVDWFAEMEDLIEEHDISIENFLSNEHETKAYCNLCQTEIVCNLHSVADHVNSEFHLNHFS